MPTRKNQPKMDTMIGGVAQLIRRAVCPPISPETSPTINDQRSTINDQRSTTNVQRPTSNDQRPTINDQRRTKT
jgi:hypothetical protein